MLGPNGAGKTSTVETLEGYRRPAAGEVRVLGLDPVADHGALTGRIGVMLQRGGVYPMLGPRRVLDLFGRYYPDPLPTDDLLDLVGLRAVAATPWRHLSGGEQQRLSLALALVGRPEVAFLDEPTAGVDPEGRIAVRGVVADLKEKGVCVVLTTHELTEAERMADRIVILSSGRVVLEGTPHDLTAGASSAAGAGRPVVTFGAPPALDTGALAAAVGHRNGRHRDRARPLPGRGGRRSANPRGHRGHRHLAGRARRHAHRPRGGPDARGRLLRGGRRGSCRGRATTRSSRRRRRTQRRRAATMSMTAGALRPLTAQTGAEIYMTLRRGRDAAPDPRHPRRVPAVLLQGVRRVDAHGDAGRLLRARHPRPRRHVDRHGVARHRHRIRTRLRRAQASRRRPRSAAPACWAPRSSPSSPSSWSRRPCCCPSGSPSAGTRAATHPRPWPAPSARSCSARPPSPASACSWPGRCGRR